MDKRLQSLIRVETTNLETKGQLEFLLNLLLKGGDQIIDQTTDDEQDNDDVKNFRLDILFERIVFCDDGFRKIKISWKRISILLTH